MFLLGKMSIRSLLTAMNSCPSLSNLIYLLTIDADEFENLSLSSETGEKSVGELISTDFRPNCIDSKLRLLSMSETFDSLGAVRVVSWLS